MQQVSKQETRFRYIPAVLFIAGGLVLWMIFSGLAVSSLQKTGSSFTVDDRTSLPVGAEGSYNIFYEAPKPNEGLGHVDILFTGEITGEKTASYAVSEPESYTVFGQHGLLVARVNFVKVDQYKTSFILNDETLDSTLTFRLHKGFPWQPVLYGFTALVGGGVLLAIGFLIFAITLLQNNWQAALQSLSRTRLAVQLVNITALGKEKIASRLQLLKLFARDEAAFRDTSYEESRVFALAKELGLQARQKDQAFCMIAPYRTEEAVEEISKSIELLGLTKK